MARGAGRLAFALLFALATPGAAQDAVPPESPASQVPTAPTRPPRIEEGRSIVDVAIGAVELEAHVAWLTLHGEGRATGTPGAAAAADYLAARLAESGLEPAGDFDAAGRRTYLQDVGLVRREPAGTAELVLFGPGDARHELRAGTDFSVERLGAVDGEFPITRVIGLIELGSDVPALVATAESTARTTQWLRRRGDAPVPEVLLTGGPARPGAPRGAGRLERGGTRGSAAVLRVHRDWMERVLAGEFERALVRVPVREERVPAHNVLARLAAAEGLAAPEAIVLSAHYDHLGTRELRPGEDPDADLVFDGADDDASGVAAVLEIAESLALGPAPRREVIVLLATAEEIGLLGTLHYLDHPVAPLERTVLNLNFEMVGRPDPLLGPGRLWLTGAERTNLHTALIERGFDLAADPRPEQDFFRRSDNFAFARLGIVAQTLSSFGMHSEYHTERDAWWTLDYEHMAEALKPALEIARLAAAGELAPEWAPGGRPE